MQKGTWFETESETPDTECLSDQKDACTLPKRYFTNFIKIPSTSDSSNHCIRLYILDLSPKFMSENEFNVDLKYFLIESIKACMNNGIGDLIRIGVFDQIHSDDTHHFTGFYECRNSSKCNNLIQNLDYKNMTVNYQNETEIFITDTLFMFEYSDSLTTTLKSMFFCPCKLNSAVLLTNRIVNVTANSGINYTNVIDSSCTEFTVILLGRKDEKDYNDTLELLSDTYGLIHSSMNHSNNVFNVPDYNCLRNLTTCIPPCDTSTCEGMILDNCPKIVTTTTSTTTTASLTTTWQPIINIPETSLILYVLAFSNRFTQTNLTTVLDNLIPPLSEIDSLSKYSFKIIISSKNSSQWFSSVNDFKNFLNSIKIEQTEIIADAIDDTEKETIDRLQLAKFEGPILDGIDSPIIILLTDFYSTKFADIYQKPDEPLRNYKLFRVYVFDSITYENYKNLNTELIYFSNVQINETVPLFPTDGSMATSTTAGKHFYTHIFTIFDFIETKFSEVYF
uniref:VWFA domain-containing protein n=1 Tax=Panagrolaimus davidi TaxID=227884 RepID=A0A914PPE2_9BILA